ncbi:MAG TPA: hypothetical protein VGH91_04515 [Gammaproteobacteria bacterium]|jgi:hypothetical protein
MSALQKHTIELGVAVNKGTTYGPANAKGDRVGAVMIPNIATPASASAVTGTTITAAGSGYTNPANITFTPGTGTAAVICTALKVVTGTVVFGGTSGFAVNDTITLSNGAVLTVATVSAGVVLTVTVSTPGSFTGQVATNPVSQTATSGVGVGITTWTLSYGVLTVAIAESGNGSNPTWTTTSSDAGTGATITTTQGGNSNAIYVKVASNEIPANCVATFDTNFACNGWVALKRNGYVTFALQPIGATTLAAGTMDAIVLC